MPRLRLDRRAAGRWLAASLLVLFGSLLNAAPATAGDIVLIEEDWELVLGEPDPAVSAPQVTMVVSPFGNLDGSYFLFTLNYVSFPDYYAGGMQVQRWVGDDVVDCRNGNKWGTLHHYNEVLSWTHRLSVNEENGAITFEIVDGASDSWGGFGGEGYLKDTIAGAGNLNGYLPSVSIGQSGVSYAGNRVSNLTLKKLRWEFSDGTTGELTAPIDIDADLDP